MGGRRGDGNGRRVRLGDPGRGLEEELRFHFEESVAELVGAGWSAEAAEAEAHRRFGDEAAYRRTLGRIDRGLDRRRRWGRRLDATESTMRQVLRGIVRSPGLTAGVVLAFALGIGVNAVMFGIVDRLLLSPPSHVVDAGGVRRLVVDRYVSFLNDRVQSVSLAYADYTDLVGLPQFTAVAGYMPRQVVIGRGESAAPASAVMVSASWWALLGVGPQLGRFWTEEEDGIGGEPVAVIGHTLWRRMFGGDASALGRTIAFGYGPFTIIGVAPKGFTGIDLGRVDVWVPLRLAGAKMLGEEWVGPQRSMYWLRAVGRMAPGTSVGVAGEAATAAHRAGRAAAGSRQYDPEARIVPAPVMAARAALEPGREWGFAGNAAAQQARVTLWLAGVSLVVLLIACVNVANLLLARAIRRRRESAIRIALGVSRTRLIGQTLAEGLAMAALGGAAALLVAHWGGDVVRRVLLPGVEFPDGGLGTRVLPFVAGLAAIAGVVSAVVPALEAARRGPVESIRASAGGISRGMNRMRGSLAIAQSALSVLLLVGAGLFLRSLRAVGAMDLGFDPDGLYVAMPGVEGGSLTEEEKRVFFASAAERLAAQPGIEDVAWSAGVPFYYSWSVRVRLPGRDSLPVARSGGPYVNGVNLDYFRTLDLRILRGRAFEPADFASGLSVVVNDALARLWWPDIDPLGECMRIGEADDAPCSTVIGVVEDARRGSLFEDANPQYYLPNTHSALENHGEALFIRIRGDEAATIAAVRRTLLDNSARLRFVDIQPISDLSGGEVRAWRLGATMFSLFGLLALVVAALGLYSVLAFDVAQRTREIGLRNALGAGGARIMAGVVGQALRIVAAGMALGILLALALAPRIEPLLFQTPGRDPLTILAVTGVLLLAAVIAAGLPAWRATRVDPNIALRAD